MNSIKRKRIEHGMTQTDLAEAMETWQSVVARWEGGQQPSVKNLVKLAVVLQCEIADLLEK